MPETEVKKRTVGDWLKELAESNTSTQEDEGKMLGVLRKVGFNSVVITCGIVYLEGSGTPEAPPMPIQGIAGMILKSITK